MSSDPAPEPAGRGPESDRDTDADADAGTGAAGDGEDGGGGGGGGYAVGPTYARTAYARLETKAGRGTGAGYERWRSYEWRPSTARRSKEDVYVPVHRLLAVVACYPEDMPIGDVLAHLDGRDVHHESGVKWDNRPGNLQVCDHGQHSAITQRQMRAWASDAKQQVERERREGLSPGGGGGPGGGECSAAGCAGEAAARVPGLDGEWCLPCATERADGRTIEVI